MRWFIPFLFVVLSACSGGGGTLDPLDPSGPGDPTDPTDPSGLPLSGLASYAGQLSFGLPRAGIAPATITSPLTVAVNFGATDVQVTGQARSFAGFEGALFLTLGEIDRAPAAGAPSYAGSISGTLKAGADSYLVFGQFDGDFLGEGQAAMSGQVSGNVRTTTDQSSFTGSYQAARAQ